MQDKTINNALVALYHAGEGLDHVEALMALRCIPKPAPKRPAQFRRRLLRQVVLGELQRGAKTCPQITDVAHVMRPDLTRKQANQRVYMVLCRLSKQGRVVQDFGPDGWLWRVKRQFQA